jgi:predicted MFS family arabinose efflux permease
MTASSGSGWTSRFGSQATAASLRSMVLTRAALRAGEPRSEAVIRRLVLVVGAVAFLDTTFYAVIAPLLPQLTHELRLSKLSAGVMTAGYPIGMLVASLPGGILAARVGPRLTVMLGLLLLACSTIAFGLVHSAAALDLARVVEGVGGACSWAGGIAWIVAEAPVDRRGEMIGKAVGAAVGGALFGPAIGALASFTGRPVLFCALAAIAIGLMAVTRTLPDDAESSGQGVRAVVAAIGKRPMPVALWLMLLPAIGSGILNVLGPLRMHRFGAGALAIGATWLVAAGLEALVAPAVGRVSDRHGRIVPLRAGFAAAAAILACFTLPASAAMLAVVIICTAVSFGFFWAPAMALLSDVSEVVGLDHALGAALMNLAWAGGVILGSAGGGAIAKASSDLVPTAGTALVFALTAAVLLRRRSAARDWPLRAPSRAAS